MREIVVIERSTVAENGRTVLRERKYHGLLQEGGGFHLLSYCGKRIPLSQTQMERPARIRSQKNEAA